MLFSSLPYKRLKAVASHWEAADYDRKNKAARQFIRQAIYGDPACKLVALAAVGQSSRLRPQQYLLVTGTSVPFMTTLRKANRRAPAPR
jgi:hypothetical protein